MRIKLLLFVLLLAPLLYAQNADSTGRVKSSWYVRATPIAVYTGKGLYYDRITQNVELGRSIGVVDIGLVYGRTSQRLDTTNFLEAKVTMDICQYGIFSSEFSIGAGKVFRAQRSLMLDVSCTIFAQLGKNWGLGVVTGYYDFSGKTSSVGKNYFGVYLRLGLIRDYQGFLHGRPGHFHGGHR